VTSVHVVQILWNHMVENVAWKKAMYMISHKKYIACCGAEPQKALVHLVGKSEDVSIASFWSHAVVHGPWLCVRGGNRWDGGYIRRL
jgi:hypothetical protein